MKILKASEIRSADQFTILHEPISSIDLMERASASCFHWLIANLDLNRRISVYCGIGNNGGDGLAIARMLQIHGCEVLVYAIGDPTKGSEDFKINLDRWINRNGQFTPIQSHDHLPVHQKGELIIDAIFGTGLSRAAEGLALAAIQHINKAAVEVVSIDLPSGMFSEDNSSTDSDAIIQANVTLTFQSPKLAFLLSDAGEKTGNFFILDIGLDGSFFDSCNSRLFFTQQEDITKFHLARKRFSHKGTFGHSLLIAGSKGKIGAAELACKAALKMGSGLVTAFIPGCGYTAIQTAVPEAMCITSDESDFISGALEWNQYTSVGIGPGLSTKTQTKSTLTSLLKNCTKPIVLDADALNLISEDPALLKLVPKNSILTPHPKEFDRLFGTSTSAYARLLKQIDVAQEYQLILILKGAYTSIVSGDGSVYFNSSGNACLATGGSGDVLTGMITALLAQGYSEIESAKMATFMHGMTANLWSEKFKAAPMTASDIIDLIPQVYKILNS